MKKSTQREPDNRVRFAVIPPDGYGSKGDEAMISGLLNLLQGEKTLLLTQNYKQWSDILLGRTYLFDECVVALEKMPEQLPDVEWLAVIGADTLDGSCGYEAAYWRLQTIKTAVSRGIRVVVFCSIRSCMEERIVEEWRSLPEGVQVFLRDSVSEKNFADQIGYPAQHFSDLAFFAKPIISKRAAYLQKLVESAKKSANIIGLQISETMFRSFHTEITDDMRSAFAKRVASLVISGKAEVTVVLLSHDTREWEEHWSDYHYACIAQEYLREIPGVTAIIQKPELTQAEMLPIISQLDLVICGRMHMSITAYCAGVVPLVVAGIGKNYVMIDKVRGMCREWLGTEYNLILDLEEIPRYRDKIIQEPELREILAQKREELKHTLSGEYELIKSMLQIQTVSYQAESLQEEMLTKAMQRAALLSQQLHEEYACGKNKDMHIQQLVQSERDLQADVRCKEGHIEQLLQSERDLLAENEKKADIICKLQYDLGYQTSMADYFRKSEEMLRNQLEDAYRQIYRLEYELGSNAHR